MIKYSRKEIEQSLDVITHELKREMRVQKEIEWIEKRQQAMGEPMEAPAIVAKNIRLLQKIYAITNEDLSMRSGVGLSTVRLIKSGEYNTTLDKVEKMARVFGISMAQMFSEELMKSLGNGIVGYD